MALERKEITGKLGGILFLTKLKKNFFRKNQSMKIMEKSRGKLEISSFTDSEDPRHRRPIPLPSPPVFSEPELAEQLSFC